MPYVSQEQISCPCGGEALVGWKEIDGENVPGTYCIECGYTRIQISDLIRHEILLPSMLKDMAVALGLRLTACEERWPGLWMIGTLNGVDFYFVSDYKDTALLKLARSFTGRTKAFFFTGDDHSARKLADFVLGYACVPVDLVVNFDSDYNIIVDEKQWKPALEEFAPAPQGKKRPPYAFWDIGEFWEITFAGKTKAFAKKRGFDYIRYLIEHQEETFFLPEFICLVDKVDPNSIPQTANEGEMSDLTTIKKVREKKQELLQERNEALKNGHAETVDRISTVIDQCDDYLRRVAGRHGEAVRKFDGDLEHIRTSVRNAINRVLKLIDESLPECADHFKRSIKPRLQIGYTPSVRIEWSL